MIPSRRPEPDAAALKRRFAAPMLRDARWRAVHQAGRGLLVAYWVACLAILAAGADRVRPEIRQGAVEWLMTREGEHPFRNCTEAHRAGVYDIPSWSRAYTERQDGDGDGLACEPPPGGRRYHLLPALRW